MISDTWTETDWNRYAAIYRLASITYYREQREVHVWQRITDLVRFYRKQFTYLRPEQIAIIRSIESGAEFFDIDDCYKCVHCYTWEDDDRRLRLNDSGLALLFSIDSNWIPPSPSTGSVCLSPPAQMELGI